MELLRNLKEDIIKTASIGNYLGHIKEVISEETDAIQHYDQILELNDLPASSRAVIEEIRDDEKDHLFILSQLLQDELEEQGFSSDLEEDEDED